MARLIRFLLAVGLIASILCVPVGASADHKSCGNTTTKVNNVHWGNLTNGSRSIKVVGQIHCTAQVQSLYALISLWFCAQQEPQEDKQWLENHCSRDDNVRTWAPFPANNTQTIRAPSDASGPQTQNGWYIGWMQIVATDPHNGQPQNWAYQRFSAPALCGNDPSCVSF